MSGFVILPKSLDDLLPMQANVVTREQALARGKTRHQIATLVSRGRWQRLQTGVYYGLTGPVPRQARLWGVVLGVGRGAVLSHETAAEVWGITDERSRVIHVSVPRTAGTFPVPPGVTVHYSSRLPRAEFPIAIEEKMPPVTWADETVFDLVNTSGTAEGAVNWAIRACQRGKTDPRVIEMCLMRPGHRQLRWRADLMDALTEIKAGVQSPLERRYLHDVEQAHALPEGARQVKTKHGSKARYHDVRYVDFGVGVELDGVRWHSGDARDRDDARDNSSALAGVQTLRYGWIKVAYHPCEVAHEVWSLLVRRGYREDFHRHGEGCGSPADAPLTVKALLAAIGGSRGGR